MFEVRFRFSMVIVSVDVFENTTIEQQFSRPFQW